MQTSEKEKEKKEQSQQAHRPIVQQELKKARHASVKSSVKFLLPQGGRYSTLKFIATFLYSNKMLDNE